MFSKQFASSVFLVGCLISLSSISWAAEGSTDSSFAGPEFGRLRAVAIQVDGKILVGGSFTNVGGFVTKGVARLNSDGTLDTTFKAELNAQLPGTSLEVRALCVQTDGKILVGGQFSAAGNTQQGNFTRLLSNGSLDAGFASGLPGADGKVNSIALQDDGKILLGGTFTKVNGEPRGRISRLNPDGTLDRQFGAGGGAAGVVTDVVFQKTDGKIVICGYFTSVNGSQNKRLRIARLESDGSLDTTSFGSGADGDVYGVALQADGKIVLVGEFFNVMGQPRKRLARLGADGTLDAEFNTAADGKVSSVLVQRDGKILIGGDFTAINDLPRNRIARLLDQPAGALDRAFAEETAAGANRLIEAIAQQTDGKVIVAGDFTNVGGQPRNRVARLEATLPPDVTPPVIVLNGDNPMQVAYDSSFTDPGARVTDDTDPSPAMTISGSVNTKLAGVYVLTYVAVDSSGNSATITREVVVSPPSPPEIQLKGDEVVTVMRDRPFVDPGAWLDESGVKRDLLGNGFVDVSRAGAYQIIYSANDARGNLVNKMRVVYVTDINWVKTVPSQIKLKVGKRRKLVLLVSNNGTREEEIRPEVQLAGTGVIVPPEPISFIARGKLKDTSPSKIKRFSLPIIATAPGTTSVTIKYLGQTATSVVTVE